MKATFLARNVLPVALLLFASSACAPGKTTNPDGSSPQNDDPSSVLTENDIDRTPDEGIDKLLSGRIAGVWVTRTPSGDISVRIRGATSISASQEPLYVIDGMPIEPGPQGSLAGIRPRDIESISVLKDAAETAMYGVRGANGVIVIKMKSPGISDQR